jgi:hypothetical protein
VFSTGSSDNTNTGQTSRSVTYSLPPVPGVLDQRLLAVTVTTVSGGRTGVLAESDAIWLVPRPRSERIPAATRELDVAVTRDGQAPFARFAIVGSQLHAIERRLDRLEVGQPYVINCPAEMSQGSREVTLAFLNAAGATVARASWTAYAGWGTKSFECDEISFAVGGRSKPALLGGNFFGWLGHQLHTSFAAPGPH